MIHRDQCPKLSEMSRLSLANKCLLLFGSAVIVIIVAALAVPWARMNALVGSGQLELSREQARIWQRLDSQTRRAGQQIQADENGRVVHAGIAARYLDIDQARQLAEQDAFIRRAIRRFEQQSHETDYQQSTRLGTTLRYHYAAAIKSPPSPPSPNTPPPNTTSPDNLSPSDPERKVLTGLLLMDRQSVGAAWQLLINTAYIYGAGTIVLAMAVLLFYLITNRLILSPVRSLKRTAELVREGNLTIRSHIGTGDEFEELSEAFNAMLFALQTNQEQLRATNRAMDLKLGEMAEANRSLYEAARLKAEFLANISHELRTPMNSIIGFGELLQEIAMKEIGDTEPSPLDAKRLRYLDNIVTSANDLLSMINTLLDMAKIEAGKIQVRCVPMSLYEACEGLIGLIHPLADRKRISLKMEIAPDVPIIETDQRLFGQIIFNFLSNSVKFIPPRSTEGDAHEIILRAEQLITHSNSANECERVRISVIDTGPGIAITDQKKIFAKFQQGEGGLTREHEGTGLGLAIAQELASLLQGQIQMVSDVGRGSMFSLILPVKMDSQRSAEAKLEAAFRGKLASSRDSDQNNDY